MALEGCYACMKYLVIAFNLIFWLAGIGVLAVAIWLYVDSSVYLINTDSNMYFTAIYILMAAGIIMTLIGFLGCCGALRESPCMLGTFFILLLILFAAEITGGVWIVLNKEQIKEQLNQRLSDMVQQDYGHSDGVNKTIDAMQRGLECCGARGPSDWAMSRFFSYTKSPLEIGILKQVTGVYTVPASCCKRDTEPGLCETLRKAVILSSLGDSIYQEGCVPKLQDYLENHIKVIMGIGVGLGVLQVLGLIFAMVTCCAIRNGENFLYKA